ncbi:MAG TPA: hypothetical protein VJ756_11435 [Terriglobales bacterium]|nr:hypothetical protein [Terriglobales bacterium]
MSIRGIMFLAITLAISARPIFANQQTPHPSAGHTKEVQQHGDMAMGFSHLKTTHHFTLTSSGGYIRVAANDTADSSTREMVRMHLAHIAQSFKAGDFSSPLFTHGRVPPGAPVLKQMKDAITYEYQETESGGQVRISSRDPRAVTAIHQFLRFQIKDHQTGDSTAIER